MKALAAWLFSFLFEHVALRRRPDFIVGADNVAGPYLHRWFLIPRNKLFNVYLHCFLRDDDDRALHDHPWPWASFLLAGSYVEHTIDAGGIHRRRRYDAGTLRGHLPTFAHRVELIERTEQLPQGGQHVSKCYCWTLFLTGPRLRRWGFHCAREGWIDWERFTRAGSYGEVGEGCGS